MEGNAGTYLETDLRERLDAADTALAEKECEIVRLRKQLATERQKRQGSRQDHLARLRNSLLHRFFESLPTPVFTEAQMKRWSVKASKTVFPEAKAYRFPTEERVLLLRLEHVRYAKGDSRLLIIYGKTEEGERLKLCWRIYERNGRGISLWDSPYLIKGYPWLFTVYKPNEIAYADYCIPLFDLERITQWYAEPDEDDPLGLTNYYEVPVFHMEEEESPESRTEPDTEEPDPMRDPNASLADKIRAAMHKKRFP